MTTEEWEATLGRQLRDLRLRIWEKTVRAVADRFGIGTAPQVLKQVGEAISAWPDFAAQAGVGPSEVKRILEHHRVL